MKFVCSRGLVCQGTRDILGYRCQRRLSNRDLEQRAMEKCSYACAPEGSLTVTRELASVRHLSRAVGSDESNSISAERDTRVRGG
jgi:hypothetical protein